MKLVATNPITYRGGPVLMNPIPVYLLYHGTWSTSQIVNDFLDYLILLIESYAYASTFLYIIV